MQLLQLYSWLTFIRCGHFTKGAEKCCFSLCWSLLWKLLPSSFWWYLLYSKLNVRILASSWNKAPLIRSQSIALNIASTPTGCSFTGVIPTKAVLWIPALILEPILCILVLRKSWRTLRSLDKYWNPNTLVAVVARDRYALQRSFVIYS